MQVRQLLLCSLSSADIGFHSVTFADALISFEYIYQYSNIVKYWSMDRSDYQDKYSVFFVFFCVCVFFVFFFCFSYQMVGT